MIAVGSRRGWLTERSGISLSFSLARVIYRSSIWCSVSSRLLVPLLLPVAFCSEAEAADLSIGRNTAPPSTFTLLGLAYTGTHSDQ